jgi:hypothetical protein
MLSQCYALLSIVFMMGFVLLFDRVYLARGAARFFKNCLMSSRDIDRLRDILSACRES